MPLTGKILRRLTFRCIGALAAGVVAVMAFVTLLSLYAEAPQEHPIIKATAAQPLRFPENEQMLNDLAVQLARESKDLSGIEPAAGTVPPKN